MNILINILINGFSTLTLFSGINKIFLFFDSIVYSILEGMIGIFFTIATLDLQYLYLHFEGITKTLSTLVGIFVLFKISFILLQYLMEPDKATAKTAGSGKLIQDILVAVVMFVLLQSNILFGLFHDVQVVLLGGTSNGSDTSSFQVLDKLGISEPDTNIIQNLVWGKNDAPQDVDHSIAVKIMNMFLFHYTSSGDTIVPEAWESGGDSTCSNNILTGWTSRCTLYNIAIGVEKGGTSWLLLGNADNMFVSDLRYYAIISTVVGIYMIIMFAKSGVAIFVRSLKLVVLQLIAPLAIVSYIDQKQKKLWNDYWKLYFQLYVDLFVRLITVYISIYAMYVVIAALDGNTLTGNLGFVSSIILKVMFIFAIFQFMKDFPQIVQSLFGVKVGDGNTKSFGSILGGLVGGGVGLATGVGTGLAAGAGALGTAWSGITGAFGGGQAGANSKNVGSFVSGQISNASKTSGRSYDIANRGGLGRYAQMNWDKNMGNDKRFKNEASNMKDAVDYHNASVSNLDAVRDAAERSYLKDNNYTSKDSWINSQLGEYDQAIEQFKNGGTGVSVKYDTGRVDSSGNKEYDYKSYNSINDLYADRAKSQKSLDDQYKKNIDAHLGNSITNNTMAPELQQAYEKYNTYEQAYADKTGGVAQKIAVSSSGGTNVKTMSDTHKGEAFRNQQAYDSYTSDKRYKNLN